MNLLLLVFLFQAVNSIEDYVSYYESADVQSKVISATDKSLSAHVQFNAHGREFKLHLSTNQHLFGPGFTLKLHGKDGQIRTKKMDTRHIVIGHVIGEKNSLAHGKISGKSFEGIIHVQGESYHVEPSERYLSSSSTQNGHHNAIIYKSSDVNLTHPFTCGNNKHNHAKLQQLQESGGYFQRFKAKSNQLRKRQVSDDNTCSIHVYADYEFYSEVGNSDEATTLDTMAIHITESDTIYRSTAFQDGDTELTGYGVAITAANIITVDEASSTNPLYGEFTVDELLQAFASIDFNSVCLAHLFTYRDFSGTVGLAYVADPSGSFAGGICQQRTQTFSGELNLNTGLTTLLNFGRRLPQGVSIITTAHEIGHNFGSPHDPAECSPGGSEGNYIMYPTATDGTLPNNKKFSTCSRNIMGQTIVSKGTCFIQKPSNQICGNNIVEGTEECDCGSNDTCHQNDPCCKVGECLLIDREGVVCSPHKYACCNATCNFAPNGTICNNNEDECLTTYSCDGLNASCPVPERKNLVPCNNENNVCVDGVCSGSACLRYDATPCFCTEENKLCDVCCQFNDGPCVSLFDVPNTVNATIQSGFPCKDFTGYCDDTGECIFVDTNIPLDDLRNIIPSFTSIVNWLKDNWYWVVAGIVVTIIVIILLQVTYRRKKKPKDSSVPTEQQQALLENQRRRNEEATRL